MINFNKIYFTFLSLANDNALKVCTSYFQSQMLIIFQKNASFFLFFGKYHIVKSSKIVISTDTIVYNVQ